ncbi:hypothetical protein [Clostridium botulinum]|uniref:hypothetical protein n=1 Tax=Clostridium botulinum TaxID=1491 RepID=UPI0009477260|nr:hypothetical protein [Clostridium botulinum]APQ75882.1 putative membrane protein [Clostridium botulinum]MBN3354017.1 hypothetical protein [Clostridium botulinum]QDY29417.1 hypothetical protein CGQ41_11645 [Clostridium botulinum]
MSKLLKLCWDLNSLILSIIYILVSMIVFIKYPNLEIFKLNIPNILFTFVPVVITKGILFYMLWALVFVEKIRINNAKEIYTIVCIEMFTIVIVVKCIFNLSLTWVTILISSISTLIFWFLSMNKFNKNLYANL